MVKHNSYVLLCTSISVATYEYVYKHAYTCIPKIYYWIIMYFLFILGFRVHKPM